MKTTAEARQQNAKATEERLDRLKYSLNQFECVITEYREHKDIIQAQTDLIDTQEERIVALVESEERTAKTLTQYVEKASNFEKGMNALKFIAGEQEKELEQLRETVDLAGEVLANIRAELNAGRLALQTVNNIRESIQPWIEHLKDSSGPDDESKADLGSRLASLETRVNRLETKP